MILTIDNKNFEVELESNETSKALVELLPLKLVMQELNGNEKYCYINKSLPTDEQRVKQIHVGDIMLYGSSCLVIFYKSFSTSYSYTKIGKIKNPENLESIVGSGDVEVVWKKN